MRRTELIDPFLDPGYAALVADGQGAEIFHDRLWLELLREEYGYEIGACCVRDDERIEAAIPFARIKSRLTGNRLVALPFSDHCPPVLAADAGLESLGMLGDALAAHAAEDHLDLTVHAALPSVPEGHVAERFVRHLLTLPTDPDEAEANTSKKFSVWLSLLHTMLATSTTPVLPENPEYTKSNAGRRAGVGPA